MARNPIALPEREVSPSWDARGGRFLQHPAGLVDGIRPEWDQVRARREQLAAGATPIVKRERKRLVDVIRTLSRRARGILERRA